MTVPIPYFASDSLVLSGTQPVLAVIQDVQIKSGPYFNISNLFNNLLFCNSRLNILQYPWC